jgi:hypothetical protein
MAAKNDGASYLKMWSGGRGKEKFLNFVNIYISAAEELES